VSKEIQEIPISNFTNNNNIQTRQDLIDEIKKLTNEYGVFKITGGNKKEKAIIANIGADLNFIHNLELKLFVETDAITFSQ